MAPGPLLLGDYLQAPACPQLTATPYGSLGKTDLAEFLAAWPDLHREALSRIEHRIHPSARVHPTALIGDDVIIGPGAQVWEFTTVRDGSVIGAGASVGFNCEVTRAFIGEGAVLGHRIGINRTLVGSGAHLSANLTVAAISMWSPQMRTPEREIILRTSEGIYRCGTPQFGALIGDGVQTGNNISLGPGLAVGRNCRITSGVTLAGRTIPDHHTVSNPRTTDVHVHRHRR
ncbi:DapH/DapD/GlmU-related protein [Streptomyces sp. 135]|uniref:DapH/DapD/GlmU-related protein n=1 Tax=Streptomyces sp. 135 TaxID=2838850 RepID=UPI001CBBEDEC|nr:DapH/DapD/GlmU-related protein [Streptomyces sp. 135]